MSQPEQQKDKMNSEKGERDLDAKEFWDKSTREIMVGVDFGTVTSAMEAYRQIHASNWWGTLANQNASAFSWQNDLKEMVLWKKPVDDFFLEPQRFLEMYASEMSRTLGQLLHGLGRIASHENEDCDTYGDLFQGVVQFPDAQKEHFTELIVHDWRLHLSFANGYNLARLIGPRLASHPMNLIRIQNYDGAFIDADSETRHTERFSYPISEKEKTVTEYSLLEDTIDPAIEFNEFADRFPESNLPIILCKNKKHYKDLKAKRDKRTAVPEDRKWRDEQILVTLDPKTRKEGLPLIWADRKHRKNSQALFEEYKSYGEYTSLILPSMDLWVPLARTPSFINSKADEDQKEETEEPIIYGILLRFEDGFSSSTPLDKQCVFDAAQFKAVFTRWEPKVLETTIAGRFKNNQYA